MIKKDFQSAQTETFLIMRNPLSRARNGAADAAQPVRWRGSRAAGPLSPAPEVIAPGERRTEINLGSSFLSVYDSSFGGHQ